ncbi:MAG: hypothetical protein WCK53_04430 [Methanomicrobiales archaeon]
MNVVYRAQHHTVSINDALALVPHGSKKYRLKFIPSTGTLNRFMSRSFWNKTVADFADCLANSPDGFDTWRFNPRVTGGNPASFAHFNIVTYFRW